MPRMMRVQYPGAIYHIMNRGDRRENIFVDDVDRQDFLKTLAEACQKTSWQMHAYCLMKIISILWWRLPMRTLWRACAGSSAPTQSV